MNAAVREVAEALGAGVNWVFMGPGVRIPQDHEAVRRWKGKRRRELGGGHYL